METPTRDETTPEAIGPDDLASQASEVQSVDQPPTPSSTGRSHSPENAPVSDLQVQSQPAGPSQQRAVKAKSKGPPSRSELIGNPEITFDQHEERVRAHANNRPSHLYRSFFEDSATLSAFVPKACHKKHKDVPHLKLADENAFQNHGDFHPLLDMTPERMRRQHQTPKKIDPSPFVSTFDNLESAEEKGKTQYDESRMVPRRCAVAEIDISDLIPATIRGRMRHFKRKYMDNSLVIVNASTTTRVVRIPIWVRPIARPADGSPISFQDLHDSGADMWVRDSEMALSGPYDMRWGAADSHDNEWLCCGPVTRSCITNVMPFDGETWHQEKGYELVISKLSLEIYVFNFDKWMWEHNPDTSDYRPYRLEVPGDKRSAPGDDTEDQQSRQKRARIIRPEREPALGFSNIVTIADFPPRDTASARVRPSLYD